MSRRRRQIAGLCRRNRPAEAARDLTARTIQVRAATIDENARSVEAVLATPAQTTVLDLRTWEVIDEVLRMDGATLPQQMPLLETHDRFSLDSVLGSVRNVRREGEAIVGRLFFAAGDERADRAWNKVKQGHVTDVSVGYRVIESVEIPAGQNQTIQGVTYTAGQRRLRIATRWEPREGSLVPIGADPAAKIREDVSLSQKDFAMNSKTKKYLETLGLRAAATDAEAQQFLAGLPAEQQALAQRAADEPPAAPPPSQPPPATTAATSPPAAPPPAAPAATAGAGTAGGQRSETDILAAERQRIARLTELAARDVPADLLQRAIGEGWDQGRASQEFLTALRGARTPPLTGGGPAIHIRGHEQDCTLRNLAAGVLIAQGLDPTHHALHTGRHDPLPTDRFAVRDAEMGHRYRGLSAADLLRECIRIDGGPYATTLSEALGLLHEGARAGVSGGSLSYIFTTNAYARLVDGWLRVGDTTVGWCEEEEVPNFLQQEDINFEASAALSQLPPGDTAKHATLSDTREVYRIARYAKQFAVDEQNIIDDRLGAIMRVPALMGEAARQVRPDLVYALINQNPAMADTGLVFNNTAETTAGGHANLGTGALSTTSIKAGILAIGQHRQNNRVLNITPRYLLVPWDLKFTAEEILQSPTLLKLYADSNDPWATVYNAVAQQGLVPVADARLGATGVIDPRDGTTVRAGSATQWFLSAGPLRGMRVAYLRGSGRQPQMRSYVLDKGQWGIGYDVKLDIGAQFMDYRGWYKSTGAA